MSVKEFLQPDQDLAKIHEHDKESNKSLLVASGGGGLVAQSCLILVTPWTGNPPVSSTHGISQATILEWVTISFSRGSFQPRDWTRVSCIADRFFTN